jgi:hypothetical protein
MRIRLDHLIVNEPDGHVWEVLTVSYERQTAAR